MKHHTETQKNMILGKQLLSVKPVLVDDELIRRFESKVFYLSPDGCHYWTDEPIRITGYGRMTYNNISYRAHRLSYDIYKGNSFGFLVCHSCDNPLCVNPDHLFLGTSKDNAMDRSKKNRHDDRRGEKCPTSKLLIKDVLEIRRLYALGSSSGFLSKKFNVSRSQIGRILRKERWTLV